MVHKDTIVGIAGAAILVAAMVGVFWYEGGQGGVGGGARAYDITWVSAADNGPQESGTLSEGDTTNIIFDITDPNIVAIEFTLLWTDDAGQPDTFSLTVQGPEGTGEAIDAEATNDENGRGELRIVFPVNEMPANTSLLANGEEDAHARAMQANTKSLGVGNWTLIVSLPQAGDLVDNPLDGSALDDDGNDFEIRTIVHTYDARVG